MAEKQPFPFPLLKMSSFFGNNSKPLQPSFNKLLALHNSGSEFSHAYETLVNNLTLRNRSNPLKTLLVTSAQPLEGKTTVATNLAISMVLAKKKVLIVDTDLRRPGLHEIFELDNFSGFADILAGSSNLQALIQPVPIFLDEEEEVSQTINVMTSGRAYQHLFKQMGSEQVKRALEEMKNLFDVVILDTPPVLAVSDPLVLAPLVDKVILVLNTGVVAKEDVLSTKKQIENWGGKFVGVVMNRFNEKLHGNGLQTYFNYYNRSE